MSTTLREQSGGAVYVGQETLRRMADVDRYNAWIYDLIRPYVGRRVVEVGCGIGNMTGYFLDADLLLAFDLLSESAEWVSDKYRGRPNLLVRQGDVCDERFIRSASEHRFDTVVSINMLEHVERDRQALAHMHALLGERGRLLLFVPAGSFLYGSLDRSLGHFRRYDKRPLARKVRQAGFRIERLHYVNALGIIGWFVNSRLLRRDLLPKDQLAFFNVLAPVLQRIEARFVPPFGQSLLCIARKEPALAEGGSVAKG